MGGYHGRQSFDTETLIRSIVAFLYQPSADTVVEFPFYDLAPTKQAFFNSQIAFENRAKQFHLTIHVTTFLCLHKLHE